MAYSDFKFAQLTQRFGVQVGPGADLFAGVAEAELPAVAWNTLATYQSIATAQSTEKARSELMIAPVIFALRATHPERVSVFSGIEFNVDPSVGLNGRCDFIVSRDPMQFELRAPVCIVVEAKNENITAGLPQCLAELVAVQRYNEASNAPIRPLYGVVSSGSAWRFLRLEDRLATIDNT